MSFASESGLTVVSTADGAQEHHSYVDWAAIIAGIVLASGISLILLTFGSAIGLSFANFRTFDGVNPIWVAIAAASWLLWVQISSFMAGGYLTGRMRRRFNDATEHEVTVRDGAHGLLVWAGALVVGAIIAVGGLGASLNAIGSTAATLTDAASNVADDVDPNAYFADQLFRAPATTTVGAVTTQPATAETRAEAGRIIVTSVTGPVSDENKAYLAQLVSVNTGLPAAEATTRVDQVLAAMDDAKAKAADAAEAARKTTVLAAFLTAASLLVSAVGAHWAASMGGRHRDDGTVFDTVFRRY